MSSADRTSKRPGVPPPQENLARAIGLAFDALTEQNDAQLLWLGAEQTSGGWRLPVLDDALDVDLTARRLTTSAGQEVGPHWTILVLHYLAVGARPERMIPEVTFPDLATARSYGGVYYGRVIARLCGTAGRDSHTLTTAAEALGAQPIDGGDAAFHFQVLPRVSLRLIWHAPDDEFPSSATMLLPRNIEDFFCAEDIVVLSELLVSRLGGRPY